MVRPIKLTLNLKYLETGLSQTRTHTHSEICSSAVVCSVLRDAFFLVSTEVQLRTPQAQLPIMDWIREFIYIVLRVFGFFLFVFVCCGIAISSQTLILCYVTSRLIDSTLPQILFHSLACLIALFSVFIFTKKMQIKMCLIKFFENLFKKYFLK